MELALVIYFIGILPSIDKMCGIFIAISFGLILFTAFFTALEGSSIFEFTKRHTTFMYTLFGMMFMATLTTVAIPSEKTMYMMAGAYATQQVYQSEEARQLGSKLVKLIDKKMEQYIDEAEEAINQIVDKEVDKSIKKAVQ